MIGQAAEKYLCEVAFMVMCALEACLGISCEQHALLQVERP